VEELYNRISSAGKYLFGEFGYEYHLVNNMFISTIMENILAPPPLATSLMH
jgi:hypothetical protein